MKRSTLLALSPLRSMGNNHNVDTTSFRHAVWNYVHCLYGIRHEEYDYGVVNQLLNSKLKAFVKTVACQPERVTPHEYDSFMRDLRHSEKVAFDLSFHPSVHLLYFVGVVIKTFS